VKRNIVKRNAAEKSAARGAKNTRFFECVIFSSLKVRNMYDKPEKQNAPSLWAGGNAATYITLGDSERILIPKGLVKYTTNRIYDQAPLRIAGTIGKMAVWENSRNSHPKEDFFK
jgi:hypothetical protein